MSVAVSTTEIRYIPLQLTTQKHHTTSIHNEHPVSQKLNNAHSSRCSIFFFKFYAGKKTVHLSETLTKSRDVIKRNTILHSHAFALMTINI